MNSPVVLGYWKIRGLAERIRHILEYLSIPYTEEKYDGEEGLALWTKEVKPHLFAINPAANLPYLKDGDKVIAESDAIIIYLCHKANRSDLLGKGPEEQVKLATVQGVLKDLHTLYIRTAYGGGNPEPFEQALVHATPSLLAGLNKLQRLLGEQKYFCGGITWIDFVVADVVQTLTLVDVNLLKDAPHLVAHQKGVWGLEQLAGYFKSERYAERPCNGSNAKWK